MASPRPVPSWRRVEEPSTCANFSNTFCSFSAGMPMPVSSTRTLSWTDAVDGLAADIDQHMALLGELDGIAEQVGDDLPEAAGIADDEGGQTRIDANDQFEVLFGDARRNQRRHVLDRFGKPERRRIERQLAGIDLGEIEDVVDDGEQRIAGFDDDVGEGLLARRQLGLGEQFGHAEHAVHRRADLVAHIGQEFGFGAVGGFGLEQRFGGFGEGAADGLFHRPEDPEGDDAPARRSAARWTIAAAGRCARRPDGARRPWRCGRGSASAARTGRSGCGFRDSSTRRPVLAADIRFEIADHVARRPEQIAVDGGGIEFVDRALVESAA